MRVFEVEIEFTEDGRIIPTSPIDVAPGKYIVTITLKDVKEFVEEEISRPKRRLLFRPRDTGFLDPNDTYR
jgi:hypothetical protein